MTSAREGATDSPSAVGVGGEANKETLTIVTDRFNSGFRRGWKMLKGFILGGGIDRATGVAVTEGGWASVGTVSVV